MPFLPFAGLLIVSSCDNGNQAFVSVIPDNHKDSNSRKELQGSLDPCKELGSMSYGEGRQSFFLLQFNGGIDSKKTQLTGQVGFVLLPSNAVLKDDSPIMKNAIKVKGQNKKLISQEGDVFVYWNKAGKVSTGTVNYTIQVEKAAYKKLTSKKYQLCMVYAPNGAAGTSEVVATIPMDLTGSDSSLPDCQNIDLKALEPTEKQLNDGQGWSFKATIGESFKDGAQVGFILKKVRDDLCDADLCDLVQGVIASKNGWPTETTSFSGDMIIIPVKELRGMNPPIITDFPQSEAPIQGGKFNLHCYWIRDGHCYLSQVTESDPPSITFTGSSHSLKVSPLKLDREQQSGQVRNVKLSGGETEYCVDDQAAELPAGQQSFLLFTEGKHIVWRSSILESLCKQLIESNSNSIVTDDGTICLIADASKPLGTSAIDFFSKGTDYQYFACLFSTDDYKLKFYTQKEQVDIETTEVSKTEQPKPDKDKLEIKLDGAEANITLHKTIFFKSNYATYKLPEVKQEPSGNEISARGFVISESLSDDYSATIENFINDGKEVYRDKQFVIFKKEPQENQLKEELYNAYNKIKKQANGTYGTLDISYWVRYQDKVILSKPVSIPLSWEND